MPTIYRYGNAKITMYANDHNPPHFHLGTPEHAALISLDRLEIIAGELPKNTYEVGKAWALEHIDELWAVWDELNG
jgi:hypothetical protein